MILFKIANAKAFYSLYLLYIFNLIKANANAKANTKHGYFVAFLSLRFLDCFIILLTNSGALVVI